MKKFVVIGNPVAHSQSPNIHAAFAAQFDIDLSYAKLLATEGTFDTVVTQFFERGAGANVTVPFKEDALHFADELSEAAEQAGAVNTLSRQRGVIIGDNTDGIGLVRDIEDNHGCHFDGKKVLIIGAGGAARGVILPVAHAGPASITIVNRTVEKAQQLAEQFSPHVTIFAATFEALESEFDIVINATSASLSGQRLPLHEGVFSARTFAYDMMYGATPTLFMQMAQQRGARCSDGLGMLVEQAAKSFEIWHGVRPQTRPVIAQIRQRLSEI